MASTPNYEGAKRSGSLILANADGTTLSAAVMTGAATGTRLKEVRFCTGPTTPPGGSYVVAVVLDDTTNQTVIDVVTLYDAVNVLQAVLRYDNVFLASANCSLKFQMRTALTAGSTLHIEAFGADY